MSHCQRRACSATPHKTTKRDGALVIPLVGSACNCSCAECDEESVTTGIRAPSPKEETIMDDEKSETTEEAKAELKGAGWGEAVEASAEASAKEPQVVEAGTAELELPCLLTDEEKLSLAGELAGVHQEIDAEEDVAKASAAKHRDRLKSLYEAASEKAGIFLAGQVERRVACRIIHILELNQCRTIRLDTGEIVSERALDYSERQGKLKLDPEPEDASLDGDEPNEDEGGGLDDGGQGDLEDQLDAALDEADATNIDNPAALVGDEPAPAAKKATRGRKS